MTVKKYQIYSLLITFLITSGCARISPEVIQATGNDYNIAMQRTRDEQMLLNLVRLKYRDTPYFLEAGSVSSQLVLSSDASLSASFREQQIPETVGLGAGLAFVEQPTITYSPLQGNDFVERLLSPVSLDTLLLLINSGWSISRVFRMCVEEMNQVVNAPTASGPTPDTEPEFLKFQELTESLRKLQNRSVISTGSRKNGDKSVPELYISERYDSDPDVMSLREQLGLDPSLNEYILRAGLGSGSKSQVINIRTRSLMGVMFYLSQAVNVPAADYRAGRVTITKSQGGYEFDWSRLTRELFSISNSSEEPELSSVKTYYRGNWFYIDDSDLDAKTTFTLLTQLFSLQAGEAEGLTPVLTLPIGQ